MTEAALTHSSWDGSDLPGVPGLDKSPALQAEDSSSDRAEFQARLRVRGLPFPLLLCMSSLLLSPPIIHRARPSQWNQTGEFLGPKPES
jgi:hypothetical protein